MAEVHTLGYVGFSVSNPKKWQHLLVDTLGLQLGESPDGQSIAVRMDDLAQRIVLEPGTNDDILYAGWLFDTEARLQQFLAKLRDNGVTVEDNQPELAARRRVEKVYACVDPNGVRHEFAFGPRYATRPFKSAILRKGFVTKGLGLGHILLAAKNYDAMRDFAQNVLGLRLSDYIRAPHDTPAGPIDVDATFFHAITGRHHSFATAAIPFPKNLHHMMIEVEDFNDVGLAYDRCVAAGYDIAMGLGHHPNDQMFSFYVVTPSGPFLEFGYGGRIIDDTNWEVKAYGQLSDWGHN